MITFSLDNLEQQLQKLPILIKNGLILSLSHISPDDCKYIPPPYLDPFAKTCLIQPTQYIEKGEFIEQSRLLVLLENENTEYLGDSKVFKDSSAENYPVNLAFKTEVNNYLSYNNVSVDLKNKIQD